MKDLERDYFNNGAPFTRQFCATNHCLAMRFLIAMVTCFLLPVPSNASATDSLVNSLLSMGYDSVVANECSISFQRPVEPTEENNYFFRYGRYLDLRTLDIPDEVAVEPRQNFSQEIYEIEIQFSEDYFGLQEIRDLQAFFRWVRANYPESNYPYDHPAQGDIYMYRIHYNLLQRVQGIERLNRTTFLSQFGVSLDVEPSFALRYFERQPLEDFLSSLLEYIDQNSCGSN